MTIYVTTYLTSHDILCVSIRLKPQNSALSDVLLPNMCEGRNRVDEATEPDVLSVNTSGVRN